MGQAFKGIKGAWTEDMFERHSIHTFHI